MKINILFLLTSLLTLNSCNKDPEKNIKPEKEELDIRSNDNQVAPKPQTKISIQPSTGNDSYTPKEIKISTHITPLSFEFQLPVSYSEQDLAAYAQYSSKSDQLYLDWKNTVEPIFPLLAKTIGNTSQLKRKADLFHEKKRQNLNQKYSHTVIRVKSNKLKEILEIQTKKMMQLTNQNFDEQLQNIQNSDTPQKLANLNKRVNKLADKLGGLSGSSSAQQRKEEIALSLEKGSIRGIEPKIDTLLVKLDKAYEAYQKKRSDLYSQHKDLLARFSPIECRAVYHQDKVDIQYVEIYNRSQKEVRLKDLVVTLEMDSFLKSFDFYDTGISQWKLDGKRQHEEAILAPQTSYFYKFSKSSSSSPLFINQRFTSTFYSHNYLVGKAFRDIKEILQFNKPLNVEWACSANGKLYMSQDSKYGHIAQALKKDKNLKSQELGLINAVLQKSQMPKVSATAKSDATVELERQKVAENRKKIIELNRELNKLQKLQTDELRAIKQKQGGARGEFSLEMRQIRRKYVAQIRNLQRERLLLSRGSSNYSRPNINKAIDTINESKLGFSKEIAKINSLRSNLFNPKLSDYLVHLDAVVTLNGETYFKIKNIGELEIKQVAFQIIQTSKNKGIEKLLKYHRSYYNNSTLRSAYQQKTKVFPLAPGDSFYIKLHSHRAKDSRYLLNSVKSEAVLLATAKGGLQVSKIDGTFRFQQIYAK